MTDIEIPLLKDHDGKRTPQYRFFEILPGALSIGLIVLFVFLSAFAPIAAAIYVLSIVLVMFVRAVGIAYRVTQGRIAIARTEKIDWRTWLEELENPSEHAGRYKRYINDRDKTLRQHALNLQRLSEISGEFPKPSQIINMVIIPFYNEEYEIFEPTLQALQNSDYDIKNRLIVVVAYEQRGGQKALDTVAEIKKNWQNVFKELIFVEHPADLPDEVIGKGGNITYAGEYMKKWVKERGIDPENVIITTQDCDNSPHRKYFSFLTYTWIVTPNRQRVAFQPICLLTNNIWDVPAPVRVVATGNSFWNMISSMRPHQLRNFAAHSQSMAALIGMDFWSKRTVVEDGHQYWRSYFYFDGDYSVVPLRIGFGQSAVASTGYGKTLKAQYIQLRRWTYGASDVPYVAHNLLRKDCTVKKWAGWTRFVRLLEGHLMLAVVAPIVAFGGWVPLYLNPTAAHQNIIVNDLPIIISQIQNIAIIGLLVSVFVSITMLPPRPRRYRKTKFIIMIAQWALLPITAIVYSSCCAYSAQIHLMTGKYLDKFDVTDKVIKK
ncbi:hypothetical protein FWF74_01600 [Candidatus Saccharibacteria bacterium]|nr:hypothetical protein [Candidatus Saccharibacteria bacterium]MCL1963104.1 hypothetical protein [Candidatus Saccharibacteria bacterium]